MDALITNLSSSAPVFIPGPNLDIPPSGSATWPSVTVADLDRNVALKDAVVTGKVSVSVTPDAADAAEANQGALNEAGLEKYAFADLPTGYEGRMAFVTDGRRTGQGGGAGPGVPAYFSATAWRVFFDDSAVAI